MLLDNHFIFDLYCEDLNIFHSHKYGSLIKNLFLICLLSLSSGMLLSQSQLQLQYEWIDSTDVDRELPEIKTVHQDYASLNVYLDSLESAYRDQAYLGFAVDSIIVTDSVATVRLYHGNQYKLKELNVKPQDQALLDEVRLTNKKLDNLLLTDNNRKTISDDIIEFLENRGYPFAQVRLDSLTIVSGDISGDLVIDRNELIKFDSIDIVGPVKISQSFLSKYLDIKAGDHYDNSKVLDVPGKIKDLKFLSLANNPNILFVNKKAVLKLNTKKSKSSSFDFLIGLLRNNDTNGGSYVITGEFTAELLNKLGYGESMYIQFRRLRPETQELNVNFNYPYPFDLPFGVDGSFELYRNANDFLDVNGKIGLRYIWDSNSYVKFFYNISSSYLLQVDTTSIKSSGMLPERLDVNYNSIGLEFQSSSLDYRFNPRKGLFMNIVGQAGLKNILENTEITRLESESVNFDTIYNDLALNSYQFQANTNLAYYIPLMENISFKVANQSGAKFSGEQIFKNEFFRIGGNRLLRGFDEQSILASLYSVFTFELRFILAQENNNFTLSLPFIDYAFTYDPTFVGASKWDQPIGVGVGMNFETKAGLFNFAIASGQKEDISFDFNNLKIHFGYVNLF